MTLLPVKRANNVEITLSRMRLSNDEIKTAILDPTGQEALASPSSSKGAASSKAHGEANLRNGQHGEAKGESPPLRTQLSAENVAALLGVLPTAEELELVRAHAAEMASKGVGGGPMGRVERFFLCLDEIFAPEQRLRSIQVTQQFDERAERLSAHAASLSAACEQLHASKKLKQLLKLVLRVGNFRNGPPSPL